MKLWMKGVEILAKQSPEVKKALSEGDYNLLLDGQLKLHDWSIDWINNYTDLPKPMIAGLPLTSKGDDLQLTVIKLIGLTQKFLIPPSQGDFTIHDEFKHEGLRYRIGDFKSTFGTKIPYGNESTGHVTDHMALQDIASQFMEVFTDEPLDKRFDQLFPLFIAYGVYPLKRKTRLHKYKPVYLSSEERKELDLTELSMDKVWSVYFFLLSSFDFSIPDTQTWGVGSRIPS